MKGNSLIMMMIRAFPSFSAIVRKANEFGIESVIKLTVFLLNQNNVNNPAFFSKQRRQREGLLSGICMIVLA